MRAFVALLLTTSLLACGPDAPPPLPACPAAAATIAHPSISCPGAASELGAPTDTWHTCAWMCATYGGTLYAEVWLRYEWQGYWVLKGETLTPGDCSAVCQ